MKTIIRIEHNDGVGMFNTEAEKQVDDICPELYKRHFLGSDSTQKPFPSPGRDIPALDMWKDDKEWFCAFKSLEQFNNLVYKEEAKILIKHGYKILLLGVTEFQEAENQVLFTKESIIETKNINSLFI